MKAFSRALVEGLRQDPAAGLRQVLIEKCNFTYVAEADDGQVRGVHLREI